MSHEQVVLVLKLLGVPILNVLVSWLKKVVHISPEKKDRWLPILTVALGIIGNIALDHGIDLSTILQGAGIGALSGTAYKVTHKASK